MANTTEKKDLKTLKTRRQARKEVEKELFDNFYNTTRKRIEYAYDEEYASISRSDLRELGISCF